MPNQLERCCDQHDKCICQSECGICTCPCCKGKCKKVAPKEGECIPQPDKDLNEAIKKLSRIIDFSPVTPELKETARMYIEQKQAYDKSNYIGHLEGKIDELRQEILSSEERVREETYKDIGGYNVLKLGEHIYIKQTIAEKDIKEAEERVIRDILNLFPKTGQIWEKDVEDYAKSKNLKI